MIARVTKLTHAKNTHIQGLTVLSLYTLPEYSRLFVNFVFCLYSFCLTLILQWMFVGKITFYLHQLISVKPGKQVWCKDTLAIQKQKNCMYNICDINGIKFWGKQSINSVQLPIIHIMALLVDCVLQIKICVVFMEPWQNVCFMAYAICWKWSHRISKLDRF